MLRFLGLFLLTIPIVCQGFETELFSVKFPAQPRVERMLIGALEAVSYQVESGNPLVSYVVTVTPFLEEAKSQPLESFLASELSMWDGEVVYSTKFRHEGNDAIVFEAMLDFHGHNVFRRGVLVRRMDILVWVLVQAPEPTSPSFEKLAYQFIKSFKFNGGAEFWLPSFFSESGSHANQAPATQERPSLEDWQDAGPANGRPSSQDTENTTDPMAAWITRKSIRLAAWVSDETERIEILKLVHLEAARVGLPPELILAIIEIESEFDRYAVGVDGALGLMQIDPYWRDEIGRAEDNLLFTATNLRYGCTIIRYYYDMENGDLRSALSRFDGSVGLRKYPNKVIDALVKWTDD